MSADNWRNCPVCDPEGNADDDTPRTFREDYEIYTGEGESKCLKINYQGECQTCGLEFSYVRSIDMDLK